MGAIWDARPNDLAGVSAGPILRGPRRMGAELRSTVHNTLASCYRCLLHRSPLPIPNSEPWHFKLIYRGYFQNCGQRRSGVLEDCSL
jgi:hypothetical protein